MTASHICVSSPYLQHLLSFTLQIVPPPHIELFFQQLFPCLRNSHLEICLRLYIGEIMREDRERENIVNVWNISTLDAWQLGILKQSVWKHSEIATFFLPKLLGIFYCSPSKHRDSVIFHLTPEASQVCSVSSAYTLRLVLISGSAISSEKYIQTGVCLCQCTISKEVLK